MDAWKQISVYQKAKSMTNLPTVMETVPSCVTQLPKSNVTVQLSTLDPKQDAKMMIPADKRHEMSMENTVQIALTHMVVPLNAQKIIIYALPEPTQIIAKNKQHAPHAQKMIMVTVALHLPIALHSANLMRKNVPPPEKMIMAAHFPQHALFKKETIMENFVLYIALVYVMKAKSCALEIETIPVAKSQHSANLCPRNCGEMMLETGVQDSVPLIAKIGNKFVLQYKILVMDVQQNPYANQKLKTLMESTAQTILLPMAVLFHAKLWMD